MRVAVYTALYGGHSTLKEFDRRGVECVCYIPPPAGQAPKSDTWSFRYDGIPEPSADYVHTGFEGPRLASKYPKMLNPLAAEFDLTIWIDSTITVTRMDRLVAECAASLEGKQIALFRHPERSNITDETFASMRMPKYAQQNLEGQLLGYHAEGFPDEHQLYAGGVIARSAPMTEFGKCWLDQMSLSLQDQISLPYVLWKLRIVPGTIPGSVYGSDFHEHRWEGPDK